MEQLVQKRAKQKESISSSTATEFVCSTCSRDCHSRIGLHSHTRKFYTCTPLCSYRLSRQKEADLVVVVIVVVVVVVVVVIVVDVVVKKLLVLFPLTTIL